MPIYEYRCSACGHELEVLQKLSEARLTGCPECGKEALAKLVSAAGFQLKGSGWYATDFRGSGAKPAAKSAEGKNGEAKSESKGDSKGEAKSSGTAETASTPAASCGGKCSCH
jgi:putative FmdB family regulatory protein